MKKQLLALLLFPAISFAAKGPVEKWRIFEVTLKGPSRGNPFTEVRLGAEFSNGGLKRAVQGFYDGDGVYKIRFMPDSTGRWTYVTESNVESLRRRRGAFECIAPAPGNHGPVIVRDSLFFAYSDGKPHFSFGTTCYAWAHQGDSLAERTLRTLREGVFNKLRFCVFPKDYDWNRNEPPLYPFEGKPLKQWDFTRFNPVYFRNLETKVARLDSLGIEADLIVFHPYDRWGFQSMDERTDERYIRYLIARFSAHKNIWWSLANEFDFMQAKKPEDWDRFIRLFADNDPYHRLRSIHNGSVWYDHTHPFITHASIQSEETHRARELTARYKKPVIFDECRYEGNIPWSWGNLTPEEMVNKFWRGVTNGGFVGHGETYVTEDPVVFPWLSNDVLWWSKGGLLRGKSAPRIRFLRQIVESAPGILTPAVLFPSWMPFSAVGYRDEYFLAYFNDAQPRSMVLDLPATNSYAIEVIDAWEMTVTPLPGAISGKSLVTLPQKPYTALRIRKTGG